MLCTLKLRMDVLPVVDVGQDIAVCLFCSVENTTNTTYPLVRITFYRELCLALGHSRRQRCHLFLGECRELDADTLRFSQGFRIAAIFLVKSNNIYSSLSRFKERLGPCEEVEPGFGRSHHRILSTFRPQEIELFHPWTL